MELLSKVWPLYFQCISIKLIISDNQCICLPKDITGLRFASKFMTFYCFWYTVMIKDGNLYFTNDSKWKITACTLVKEPLQSGRLIKVGCNMVTRRLSAMYSFIAVCFEIHLRLIILISFFFPWHIHMDTCKPFWEIEGKKG